MPRPKQHKVTLAEAVKTVAGGAYDKRIEFLPDEYIVVQSPWSRPSDYLLEKARAWMALSSLPDDDQRKMKHLEEDAMDRLFHCIADWNLTLIGPNNQVRKLPVPTMEDPSGWTALDDDVQKFIDILIGEMWYNEAGSPREEAEIVGESDPNDSAPVALNTSNGQSRAS